MLAPGPRLRAAHLPADDGGAGLGDEQLDEAERRAQLVGAREEVEEGARVDDGDARGERRERRGRERGGGEDVGGEEVRVERQGGFVEEEGVAEGEELGADVAAVEG